LIKTSGSGLNGENDMRAKLIGLLLSGVLVLPVCLTGVVTAFQFRESGAVIGDEAVLLRAGNGTTVGDASAEESEAPTPGVQAAPTEPAPDADKINTDAAPESDPAAPTPGVDPSPEVSKQQLQNQSANREYFARLTVDGLLPGRLQYVDGRSRGFIPAKRVTISFVQGGKIISQARPTIDGFFQAAGLVPGYFTVVASGPEGVLAFGIEIQRALTAADNPNRDGRVKEDVQAQIEGERFQLRQTESENARDSESFLRIDAVLVPPRDIPVARRILDPFVLSPRRLPVNRVMSAAQALQNAQQTIQLVKGQRSDLAKEQTAQLAQAPAKIQGNAPKAVRGSWGTQLRLPIFYQHSDGAIGGRLTYFVPDVTNRDIHFRAPVQQGSVYFIRNGTVVQQAAADRHGRFQVAGVPVGDYTFVSTGTEGISALSHGRVI